MAVVQHRDFRHIRGLPLINLLYQIGRPLTRE
nr:MAG TPA: hypothetical protein [Caudoviricetes sp.]